MANKNIIIGMRSLSEIRERSIQIYIKNMNYSVIVISIFRNKATILQSWQQYVSAPLVEGEE